MTDNFTPLTKEDNQDNFLSLVGISLLAIFLSLFSGREMAEKLALRKETKKPEIVVIKKKQSEPKISEWVPIDLNWFNQTHDEETKSLQLQLSSLGKETLSAVEKERKKDVLQRSVQIYQIEKEEYNAMDENKDRKIDYPEFNKRTVEVYARTYPLKHQKIPGKKDGIYDSNLNLVDKTYLNKLKTNTINNNLMVIVEAGIYDQIRNSLNQYKADVESEGKYQVGFFPCNNCTKEQIKNLLKTPGVAGILMVGDLPVAWFQDTFDTQDPRVRIENYPQDLYFMDLDGMWGEQKPCQPPREVTCYTSHTGNTDPEIIFGRLTSPVQDREIELLTNYFRKNHNYRTGNFVVPFRSLNYLQNVGEDGIRWVEAINHVFPVMDTVDLPVSSKSDYMSRWRTGYENLFVVSHAEATVQLFPGGLVTYVDVRDNRPRFNFYALLGCSITNYTQENCIGLWYVFQDSNYGLTATGATKPNCVHSFEVFYAALAESKNLGEALKTQYTGNAWDHWCFGGMTLLGDPTLKILPHGGPAPTISEAPQGPCGEPCKPGYFCRCEAQPREEGTGRGGCFCVKNL